MGKLCFGYEQNNQVGLAEKAGDLALRHTPKDIWSIHSMAHVKDSKHEADQGIAFLQKCQDNWDDCVRKGSMAAHVWWHLALLHIEKGNFEEALTLYDNTVKKYAMGNDKNEEAFMNMFLMSDATALLLRLEMEKVPGLKDRWRELGEFVKTKHSGSVGCHFFFDIHVLVGLLFGESGSESVEAFDKAFLTTIEGSWNDRVIRDIGPTVVMGIKAFAEGDYVVAADTLSSVRHRMLVNTYGSIAQQEILKLVMLRAAVWAGSERLALATQLIDEHVASCYLAHKSNVVQRIQNDMVTSPAM